MVGTASSAGIGLKVEGLSPLVRKLRLLSTELPKEVRVLNLTAAKGAIPVARGLAPIGKSGKLVASIRATATPRAGWLLAGGTIKVPYGPPVHWGWPKRNIDPDPFLTEAAGRDEEHAVSEYAAGLSALIRKAGL